MTQSTVFHTVLKRITEQKEGLMLYLAHGSAQTPEDYWRAVGKFAALEVVEIEIKEAESLYMEE